MGNKSHQKSGAILAGSLPIAPDRERIALQTSCTALAIDGECHFPSLLRS